MRILLVYPGPEHSTFDVARGYERALIAWGETVKGFDYHHYIKFYTGALTHWEGINEEYKQRIDDAVKFASEQVIIEAVDFVPDVVLVVAGGALHRRAYELFYRLNIPVVLLLTESPYVDDIQIVIANTGRVSLILTNEHNSVTRLLEHTGIETRYLPHSYDPAVHYPGAVATDKQYDVFFHGTLWDERAALLGPVRDMPYKVHIGGYTLQDSIEEQRAQLLDNDQVSDFYRGCKIALNHHRTSRENGDAHIAENEAYSLGPRAYEIAACGAFQLCDDTRGELFDVFKGSVPTYGDGMDLLRAIGYYMENDDLRATMAAQALEFVQDCTFEKRAQAIVIPALQDAL